MNDSTRKNEYDQDTYDFTPDIKKMIVAWLLAEDQALKEKSGL